MIVIAKKWPSEGGYRHVSLISLLRFKEQVQETLLMPFCLSKMISLQPVLVFQPTCTCTCTCTMPTLLHVHHRTVHLVAVFWPSFLGQLAREFTATLQLSSFRKDGQTVSAMNKCTQLTSSYLGFGIVS